LNTVYQIVRNSITKENDDEKIELEDDEIPLEDMPASKRKPPTMSFNPEEMKNMDPEKLKNMQFMGKKGQPLMIIVTVNGNPTKAETEEISNIWQTSLFNAGYNFNRFNLFSRNFVFLIVISFAQNLNNFKIPDRRDTSHILFNGRITCR
jgi:hypothetical protein